MKLTIPSIFSTRKVQVVSTSKNSNKSSPRFPLPDSFAKTPLGRSMNMITFEELRIFARNPHPNLPLIVIQDENGHILKQEDVPVRTSRGRPSIALADVTYMDGGRANRAVKSHHHPYPHSTSSNTARHQPVKGGNTKAPDNNNGKLSSSPPRHRFAQLNVKYNFDDISGTAPQLASERGSRSNLAIRKAKKAKKVATAIFAEEIKDSKNSSTHKASKNGDILFGRT